MLQRFSHPTTSAGPGAWASEPPVRQIDFDALLSAGRRQLPLLIGCVASALALGIAYISTEVPLYTASSDLLIEHRQIRFVEDSYLPNPLAAFDGVVSSEMEVIQSEAVARQVVDALQLDNDATFLEDRQSPTWQFVNWLRQQVSPAAAPAEVERDLTDAVVAKLQSNLRVTRVGPAFVLKIQYTDPDPRIAARIANAYADGYLGDQVDTKYDSMRRASEWLRVRVIDLRQKVAEAELAVIQARAATSDDNALVNLSALEREAETFKNLHTTFLQRFQEAFHQQTFPMAEARIISRAHPPTWTSYPPKAVILALSLVMGGLMGVGLGAVAEYRDRGFRNSGQVRDQLRLEFLGMLPKVRFKKRRFFHTKPAAAGALDGETKLVEQRDPPLRHVLDAPGSSFCEALRSIRVAADFALPDRKQRVLGITSVLAGEGRSLVAKNFASLLAGRGYKTMLIDADLSNQGLTAALTPFAKDGLANVIHEGCTLAQVLHFEPETNLAFLPAPKGRALPRSSDLIASSGFPALLREAASQFDYVVVDLPPLAHGFDVSAAATNIDGIVCVLEWAQTPRKLVRNVLMTDQLVWEKCIGVIYNKVEPKRLRKYEQFEGRLAPA